MSNSTKSQQQFPALPAGADGGDWQNHSGRAYRVIYGRRHTSPFLPGVAVSGTAVQFDDGTIDRGDIEPAVVWLDHPDKGLTAEQARALAALILDAATEIEDWRGNRL